MITGSINSFREAIIRVVLRGAQGQEEQIEAIIDTGFNGALSLPHTLISRLGYQFRRRGRALLADGGESIFDIYEGTIIWDTSLQRVAIDSAETDPLVGMSMLHGYELNVQVIDHGSVTIKRLA